MFGFHRYSFGSAASVNHLACLEETNFSDRVLALVPERSAYSSFIIAGLSSRTKPRYFIE
jgi:hypothetical protein